MKLKRYNMEPKLMHNFGGDIILRIREQESLTGKWVKWDDLYGLHLVTIDDKIYFLNEAGHTILCFTKTTEEGYTAI